MQWQAKRAGCSAWHPLTPPTPPRPPPAGARLCRARVPRLPGLQLSPPHLRAPRPRRVRDRRFWVRLALLPAMHAGEAGGGGGRLRVARLLDMPPPPPTHTRTCTTRSQLEPIEMFHGAKRSCTAALQRRQERRAKRRLTQAWRPRLRTGHHPHQPPPPRRQPPPAPAAAACMADTSVLRGWTLSGRRRCPRRGAALAARVARLCTRPGGRTATLEVCCAVRPTRTSSLQQQQWNPVRRRKCRPAGAQGCAGTTHTCRQLTP